MFHYEWYLTTSIPTYPPWQYRALWKNEGSEKVFYGLKVFTSMEGYSDVGDQIITYVYHGIYHGMWSDHDDPSQNCHQNKPVSNICHQHRGHHGRNRNTFAHEVQKSLYIISYSLERPIMKVMDHYTILILIRTYNLVNESELEYACSSNG